MTDDDGCSNTITPHRQGSHFYYVAQCIFYDYAKSGRWRGVAKILFLLFFIFHFLLRNIDYVPANKVLNSSLVHPATPKCGLA
jgi:hypothetical protein